MELGWRHAVAAVAALFVAFLLFKMRPAQRRAPKLAAELRAARERAARAGTLAERSAALCEAGTLAARSARRPTAAAGLFLRAMRAAPTSPDAVAQAAAALAEPAPRLLEKMLWRRLAALPWDDAHRPAVRAAVDGLRDLYRRHVRDRDRAEILRKLDLLLDRADQHAEP